MRQLQILPSLEKISLLCSFVEFMKGIWLCNTGAVFIRFGLCWNRICLQTFRGFRAVFLFRKFSYKGSWLSQGVYISHWLMMLWHMPYHIIATGRSIIEEAKKFHFSYWKLVKFVKGYQVLLVFMFLNSLDGDWIFEE